MINRKEYLDRRIKDMESYFGEDTPLYVPVIPHTLFKNKKMSNHNKQVLVFWELLAERYNWENKRHTEKT